MGESPRRGRHQTTTASFGLAEQLTLKCFQSLDPVTPEKIVPTLAPTVHPKNTLNALSGRDWIQCTKSVWFQKGLGKNHEAAKIERLHPAPFSFQDIMRLIEFFTKPGEIVLDPFCGVASTLKACSFSGRQGIGIELVSEWVTAGRKRLKVEIPPEFRRSAIKQKILKGDSRRALKRFKDNHFSFVVTSPPYWGILNKKPDHKILRERVGKSLATRYSHDQRDLANIDSYSKFLEELANVFFECHRVLKEGRYLAIVVGDFRHKNKYVPYHADIIDILTKTRREARRFECHGVIILVQNAKQLFPYGYPYAFVPNVHHQYVLIFRKPKTRAAIGKKKAKSGGRH